MEIFTRFFHGIRFGFHLGRAISDETFQYRSVHKFKQFVTIQTLLLSDFYLTPFRFISTKVSIEITIKIFYSYIYTTLSYAHSYTSLFLLKLLILYTTFPARLKSCTTSER